jgi:hypothetical protein
MGTAISSTINVGTTVLDVYNPGTKQLVWTGQATKTVDPGSKPEKSKEPEQGHTKVIERFST